MAKLVIDGGRPLKGSVALAGAKNSSFKLMIGALLADGVTVIKNLSRIDEVRHVAEMIESLGGKVEFRHGREVAINTAQVSSWKIPEKFGRVSRASTLFLAPLLARFGRAVVPLPGGDAIGRRPLDRHLAALQSLGVKLEIKAGRIMAHSPHLFGSRYVFKKNSHTGTETLMLAAVLASGKSVIDGAAQEPEVDDLMYFLQRMGAKLVRRGQRIEVTGVNKLTSANYQVMPDRNQAVSYAVAALATGGEVSVVNAQAGPLAAFLDQLKTAGAGVEINPDSIHFFVKQPLKSTDIITGPHPAFMTDWQPLWSVLMTQAVGISTVVEAVFTQRFQFVPDLIQMGARIKLFDPKPAMPEEFYNFNLADDLKPDRHGLRIAGPSPLRGGTFAIKDIRNGATLAIAGLAAQGKTILTQAELIDRGYEDFTGNLASLGARIERVKS